MEDRQIEQGFEYARAYYEAQGVDILQAMERVDAIPVSMHCWQGDDVIGFDGIGKLTGGIATTGNYPGRATTPAELRQDIDKALSLIPGTVKLSLHASYAEKNGKRIDRDAYTVREFSGWLQWAKASNIGLDFNPTFFSHPMMDGDFTLSSSKPEVRSFWIEHGRRCREIALAFAQELNKPCVVNYWMTDGYKDICADTVYHRELMTQALDEIFKAPISETLVPCAIESKLFGMGIESYTVASHEYAMLYALSRKKLYTLDAGHFHPTEFISAKISAALCFLDEILLHVSRGVRWDSDHVVIFDDELQRIMDEVLFNGYDKRVHIGLDYFDASINRIAAWCIGMRNVRKAMLCAAVAPIAKIREAERNKDYTLRFAMQEERRTMPFGAIWDYYCMSRGVPAGQDWLNEVLSYERNVLSKR